MTSLTTTRRQEPPRPDRIPFFFFALLLVLSPLPLGSARPLAWDVLAIGIAVLILASLRLPAGNFRVVRPVAVPALLLAAVLLYIAVQAAGWTPAAWHNPMWEQAREALDLQVADAIAVNRGAAVTHLLLLLSYAGAFYLALVFAAEPRRAAALLKIIGISGSVYAAYGLAVYWSGNATVLWLAKWAYEKDLAGTFVNRNSFATYLGLATLALLAHLLRRLAELRLAGSRRAQIAAVIEALSARAWALVCLFIVVTALFLTHSRGGFLATLAGLLALALGLALAPSLRPYRALRWVALASLLIAVALVIAGGPTLTRIFETEVNSEERMSVYRLVLRAIADYPYLGIGSGSFSSVFPVYRTAAVPGNYDLAHNDYLENLLELGIPAASLLFAALLWLTVLCFLGLRRRRRDAIFPCLGFAASVLVGVHSATDFSLQIPAVTIAYVAILGVGVAQSQPARAPSFVRAS